MTPQEKQHRAQEANRLTEEPLLKEALDALERAAVEDLVALKPNEPEMALRLLLERIRVIRGIRTELQTIIQNGQQAARQRPAIA